MFTREQFRVDTVLPAIQTAASIFAAQILGRLGHYSVSSQTIALVAIVASVVSSLAQNIFEKAAYQYASIPVGVAVGVVAQRFFYPATPVLDFKGILLLVSILSSVKLISENLYRLRKEKVVDDIKSDIDSI